MDSRDIYKKFLNVLAPDRRCVGLSVYVTFVNKDFSFLYSVGYN